MAVIVVGGTHRGVGKTALVCGLIGALREFRWTAVTVPGGGGGSCPAGVRAGERSFRAAGCALGQAGAGRTRHLRVQPDCGVSGARSLPHGAGRRRAGFRSGPAQAFVLPCRPIRRCDGGAGGSGWDGAGVKAGLPPCEPGAGVPGDAGLASFAVIQGWNAQGSGDSGP